MALLLLKKISLFSLLVSASLLSTSLAGRQSKSLAKEVDSTYDQKTSSKALLLQEEDEMSSVVIHERVLKANTNDYGRYDPAPALVRPPFKLIPN